MASSAILLLCCLAFAFAFADVGHYVPKGFYTIDRNGQISPFVSLGPGLRVPRSVSFSSASASSSSSSNGQGQSQTFIAAGNGPLLHPFPVPAIAAAPIYNNYDPISDGNLHQATVGLFNRFGGDEVQGISVSGTSTGGNGVFSSSSTKVDSDGRVHYQTQSGKF